jgi:glycosyltransferase involved in cell wall biosynthesis
LTQTDDGPDGTVPPVDVSVSVIVPAYRAERTLRRCLEALLCQEGAPPYEVVAVVSADRADLLPVLPEDTRLRVLTHVPRLTAAAARNTGARAARAPLLAFTDADVVAPPKWLAALVAASDGGCRCIAGSVENGTEHSRAGTAEYLIQFLDLHPARPTRTAWHGATCNLLVPRALWDRFGPFPEDMDGGEDTLLTARLRRDGLFSFAPQASVLHLNRTRLSDVLAHQYDFGRFTARVARRSPYYKLGLLVRQWPLAPVAAIARLVSLYARVFAWVPEARADALMVLPIVVAGLSSWGVGVLVEGIRIARSQNAS